MKVKKKIIGQKIGTVLSFRPQVRSRHPSHDPLRSQLAKLPFRSLIRLGSTTKADDNRTELNSIEAIKNSSSKLRMKNCFAKLGVKTADWIQPKSVDEIKAFFKKNFENGIVLKSHMGSRGRGNTLVRSTDELNKWLAAHNDIKNYLVERFYNYAREYRLHVDKNGCFYTCRKMLKSDVPDDKRWYKNNDNCVWIMEENASFDKPVNWDLVVSESVKAVKAVGLDFGAVDLRIQSAKAGRNPDFIVVEINSAPSFGEVTLQKYLERLPQLLKDKHNQ